MKSRLMSQVLCAAVFLTAVSPAYSQYAGGDYDPFTIRSSTIQEGMQRGTADVLRSQGLRAKLNAEAAVTFGQAYQQSLENGMAALETLYDMRKRAKTLRMAERGSRPDPETLARFARNGRPDRLSPSELHPPTGRIRWPILIRDEGFADARAQIEEIFQRRADKDRLDAQEFIEVRELTEAMQAELKDGVRQLPPTEYVQAKRFLESVAYEAAQPAAPLAGLAMQR